MSAHLSEAKRRRARELVDQGRGVSAIAQELGCHRTTVARALAKVLTSGGAVAEHRPKSHLRPREITAKPFSDDWWDQNHRLACKGFAAGLRAERRERGAVSPQARFAQVAAHARINSSRLKTNAGPER